MRYAHTVKNTPDSVIDFLSTWILGYDHIEDIINDKLTDEVRKFFREIDDNESTILYKGVEGDTYKSKLFESWSSDFNTAFEATKGKGIVVARYITNDNILVNITKFLNNCDDELHDTIIRHFVKSENEYIISNEM